MKNRRTHFVFSFPLDFSLQSYAPFLDVFLLCYYKLMEPCQQNIWRTARTKIMIFSSQIVTKV